MSRIPTQLLAAAASLLAAGGLAASATAGPEPQQGSASCAFANGVVEISLPGESDSVTLHRSGDRIVVRGGTFVGDGDDEDPFEQLESELPCAGAEPSVTNTDRIEFTGATGVQLAAIDQDGRSEGAGFMKRPGGSFVPGATGEGDGTSEIELSVSGIEFVILDPVPVRGKDVLRLGSARGLDRANLNPRAEGRSKADPDVAIAGASAVFSYAASSLYFARGNARLFAGGGAGFAGPARGDVVLTARSVTGGNGDDALRSGAVGHGGRGDDVLVGGGFDEFDFPRRHKLTGGAGRDLLLGYAGDDELRGGDGNDSLDGGKGGDLISGGSGRDFLEADEGSDRVRARDGDRDTIDCGRGTDSAAADRRDRRKHCERT
jgi:Ca2+-binding RTX toxin-like protein